ncbi:unnamed protein product [Pocillopora meandrina]|uniref:Uncharacterized protein n=1 Tax=Pocillopora meandrina TaxID=46732 RepID=A0AAU9VME1_9CNID|nr:unnamed protein product [Pocillopora meandrina]
MNSLLGVLLISLQIYPGTSVYGQRIYESSRSERVNNGDRLVLNCSDRNLDQFQGNANFTWKKNSVTIPNDDPRLNADGKGTLLLEHVRQRDSGQYTCTFGSADVFSISNMTLFVIGRTSPNSPTTKVMHYRKHSAQRGNDPSNGVTSTSSVAETAMTSLIASHTRLVYSVTIKSSTTRSVILSSVTTSRAQKHSVTTSYVTRSSITTIRVTTNSVKSRYITTGSATTNPVITSSITTSNVRKSSILASRVTTNSAATGSVMAGSVMKSRIMAISVTTNDDTKSSVVKSNVTISCVTTNSTTSGGVTRSSVTRSSVTTSRVMIISVKTNGDTKSNVAKNRVATSPVTTNGVKKSNVTTISITRRGDTPSSVSMVLYTTAIVATKQPSPSPRLFTQTTTNLISSLQLQYQLSHTQVEALLIGDKPTNISTVLTELVKLTKPGNELKVNASELSLSLDILEKLVTYNSLENHTAITTPADQRNVLEVASNLLNEENVETWLMLEENQGNIIGLLLKTMEEFGSQVSSQLGRSINSTSFVLLSRNIAFRVDRLNRNETLHVNFAQHGATFFAPGSMFLDPPGSRVSTIVYKTLHNVFRLKEKGFSEAQKEGGKLQTIGSSIISATVLPTPKFPLAKPVKLVFKRNNQSRNLIGQCVFWEIGRSQRTWLTRGCTRVDHESNAKVTTCECDHLTIFAILMKNKPVQAQHQHNLEYISTIGCACSLLFLLLTFTVVVLCWKQVKSIRVIMLLNLCVAIAASCFLIILVGYAKKKEMLCTVTAVSLHYWTFVVPVAIIVLVSGVLVFVIVTEALKVERQKSAKSTFLIKNIRTVCNHVIFHLSVNAISKYVSYFINLTNNDN